MGIEASSVKNICCVLSFTSPLLLSLAPSLALDPHRATHPALPHPALPPTPFWLSVPRPLASLAPLLPSLSRLTLSRPPSLPPTPTAHAVEAGRTAGHAHGDGDRARGEGHRRAPGVHAQDEPGLHRSRRADLQAHRQGLTLVHFSAQLERCLTHKNTLHPLNTT